LQQCIDAALNAKILTEAEAAELYRVDRLCSDVIEVDDFNASELGEAQTNHKPAKKYARESSAKERDQRFN
jgi:hypothetical protein